MPRPIRHLDYWLWVGGPVPPGADAITLGSLVITTGAAAESAHFEELLLVHEATHVRQWREHGVIGFLVRYLGAYLRWRLRGYGHWAAYRRIPFEAEAVWDARCGVRSHATASDPLPADALVP